MDTVFTIPLLVVLAGVNAAAFWLMGWDKARSKEPGALRVAERRFFALALLGGALGVWVGMVVFRHKTRIWYFQLGVPCLVLGQGWLLYHIQY